MRKIGTCTICGGGISRFGFDRWYHDAWYVWDHAPVPVTTYSTHTTAVSR